MPNNTEFEIRENSSSEPIDLDRKDIDYLNESVFKDTITVQRHLTEDKYIIKNDSYVGVIELPTGRRIILSTKVKANLFYILSFLKYDESRSKPTFKFDSEVTIDVRGGENFFDIIGRLFLNELRSIRQQGLLKKYVTFEDNLSYARGKLLVHKQLHNIFSGNPQLACRYSDLTYNNLENHIILSASHQLLSLIRFSNELRGELLDEEHYLRSNVTLRKVAPQECDLVTYSRLNDHYSDIIRFSKVILEEKFIRSTERGPAKGFNFVVAMHKAYEDFMTELIRELVNEDPAYSRYSVKSQSTYKTLDDEGKLRIIPDIIITDKEDNNEIRVILDAKYKLSDNSQDYYQVISYALALPSAKKCILVYPREDIDDGVINVNRNLLKEGEKIQVQTVGFDLHLDEDISYKEYIAKLKTSIKEKILNPVLAA